ncbi:MAG: AsmA family protein [Magnetococcus sp. DMHC-8]
MAKVFKILLFLVLVPVIGLVGLLLLFDPNAHKAQIAQLVEAHTGRHLTIREDFSLSFYPRLGIRLGAMELGNAPGFGSEPFATIAAAQVQVKLQPLLQRRLEVDTVTIEGLHLNLAKNAAGANNWADMNPAAKRSPAPSPATAQAPQATPGQGVPSPAAGPVAAQPPLLAAMTVEGIQIRDARLTWRDAARPGQVKTVIVPTLTTGSLQEGAPVPLTVQLHLEEGSGGSPAFDLSLRGTLVANPADKVLRIKPLHALLTALGKGMPGGKATLDSTGNLELDWQKGTLRLEEWQLAGAGLHLSGRLAGQGIFSAPQWTGTLTAQPFPLREVLQQWGIPVAATRDPKVLGSMEGAIPFAVHQDTVTLSDMQLRLDESRVRGQLTVQDFSHPVVRWDLLLDALDLDRYRSPAAAAPAGGEGTPSAADGAAPSATHKEGGPAPWLRTLDAKGRLQVDKLKVANLALQGVDLSLQGRNGVWQLAPLKARLYQGALAMEARWDVTQAIPQMAVDGRLDRVQAGPLLQDLNGHDPLTGLATVNTHLTMAGDTADMIKKSLNGTAKFALKEGVIKGIDIPKLLNDAYLALQGQGVAAHEGAQVTAFTSLEGSATIAKGVVENRDLNMVSPLLRIRGEGTANLPSDQVDYRLNASVQEALQGKGGRTVTELTGLTVPIQVTGPMAKLSWHLDLKTLLEQGVAKKAKEKLEEKLQDKAADLLKKQGLENVLPADAGKRLLNALPFR